MGEDSVRGTGRGGAGWLAERAPLLWSLLTTRRRWSLVFIAFLFVVTAYSRYVILLAESDGLFTTLGPMVGGDFVVFRTAAQVIGTPAMTAIYKMGNLEAMLRAAFPSHAPMLVGWQYPPSMYFVVAPLAWVPFLVGFALWVAVPGAAFAATLRAHWHDRTALFFALASPAVMQSVITDQTGFLTGTLLALAALHADSRPLLAGAAAGLLTVKPQFGLLLPIAFVAAGSWRTIASATATTAALVGASLLAFGTAPWGAFVEAVTTHGARLTAASGFPFEKLMTPYGAARLLGVSSGVAMTSQVIVTLALAVVVFAVWRRVRSRERRFAVLATAAMLATPYGFYYEMALLVPPMLAVARDADRHGWLRGEALSLMVLWMASLLPPGAAGVPAVPTSFLVALGAFLIAARRARAPLAAASAAGTPPDFIPLTT